MTEKLYDKDSFLKEFDATVLKCEEYFDNYAVLLDRTAFFPEAGGQKSDIGYLDNAKVIDVQISNGFINHITDTPLPVGSTVTGSIDFERRFDFMQQHSAEHIVSGVANKLFGCENVGFHLSEDIVTLDFDRPLNQDEISKIEVIANEAIYKDVTFNCYYPAQSTLDALQYRSKKEPDGAVRIVEIEDTDICACCAPHVKSAGQIGLIKLLCAQKLRGGVRIELVAGKRALLDYNVRHRNVSEISTLLCVKAGDCADAVKRQTEYIKELKFEIFGYKNKVIEKMVETFNQNSLTTAHFENDFDVKELQNFADQLCKKWGGIRGAFSKKGTGFNFAICSNDDLECFFNKFKKKFNCQGGGRNGMVQGFVIADEQEITDFFKGF